MKNWINKLTYICTKLPWQAVKLFFSIQTIEEMLLKRLEEASIAAIRQWLADERHSGSTIIFVPSEEVFMFAELPQPAPSVCYSERALYCGGQYFTRKYIAESDEFEFSKPQAVFLAPLESSTAKNEESQNTIITEQIRQIVEKYKDK